MKKLVLLAGDGIGPEIMAQAEKVLSQLQADGLAVTTQQANLGGCAVDAEGAPYPESTQQAVQNADAVLLGSVGGPKWDTLPRHLRPESGLLAIRKDLGLYANLRPVRVFPELADRSSLKQSIVEDLDLLIVRELTGGIYFGQPRGLREVDGLREGFNTLHYNEEEVRRIAHVAFRAAQGRDKRVCSVDKMNVLEASQLWRDVVEEVAAEYPEVSVSHMLVDNAAMQLVREPKQFDVILTSNLFGDILSDQASMLTGSIGLLPSASIRADGVGLYEPIHGSAPDIAGLDRANPIAMILSLALLLRHSLGEEAYAKKVEQAVAQLLSEGWRSADLSGKDEPFKTTNEIGDAIVGLLA
ncbi:3-isopropylmalate dehydrogenase [Suttonella sp. R2A3]|uniref:3-isopropylmalate dehydrogenase n=1 Tax=Suttonella sp. R2A3 TaxID=2908648 RepID=UPI001F319437|nr:3-isopropylmalate dehydrogenase [Suttonella sp. R2A3]UJF24789.1 3-isopropylmalate dehydrogenase [Suttonella sp. R2A3]